MGNHHSSQKKEKRKSKRGSKSALSDAGEAAARRFQASGGGGGGGGGRASTDYKPSKAKKHKLKSSDLEQRIEIASKTGGLSLRGFTLSQLPEAVLHLSKLRTLDAGANQLTTIPQQLATLVHLKKLHLDDNQLSEAANFDTLTRLQELNLSMNRITLVPSLPQSLLELDLSHNPLDEVPSLYLPKLKTLRLAATGLETFPSIVVGCPEVREIDLNDNAIGDLNSAESVFSKVPKLQVLLLKNNRLRGYPCPFPASLFTDTSLHTLQLQGNEIRQAQIQEYPGVESFLARRKARLDKALSAGVKPPTDLCGLTA